jgi:hypothetical protein
LSFNFEKDAVHLVNKNHGLQDLGQFRSIVFNLTIQKVALQIYYAVGRNPWELALGSQVLSVGEITVGLGVEGGECSGEGPSDKVVNH